MKLLDRYQYGGLVSRLEAEASHNPIAFPSKVLLISGAAYVALFGTLLGGAALVYGISQWALTRQNAFYLVQIGFLGLALAPLLLIVTRMFFMRLEPPSGRVVTPEEAPKLFEILRKMRKKLKGPAIHKVLIDREFNASISQVPLFGLFGMHKNYLVLGLPYLLAVPPKEMLATVSHEYGHLCGNHGKLGAWVYRQRRILHAVNEKIQQSNESHIVTGMIGRMLQKLMPYYDAYTFVMARQNEYDADRTATELVGADVNAVGLVRDALLGRWVHEEFWPKLYAQANTSAEPLFRPFASMRSVFEAGREQWATKERLTAAWRQSSDFFDTHPCLRDRVEATGQPAILPGAVTKSAAEALLGDTAKILVKEFDEAWWHEEKSGWQNRFRYVTRSKARLAELSARQLGDLPVQDLHELALLKAEFESDQSAKPVLEYLMRQPGGPFAKPEYLYGTILLREGQERGLDFLATAAQTDRNLTQDAAEAGYFYLLEKHDKQTADRWWHKIYPDESDD